MVHIDAWQYGAAALAGLFTHVLYFNRSEHHLYGTRYLQAFLGLCGGASLVLSRLAHVAWKEAAWTTAGVAGAFLGGLYASLLFYRAFLHPLNKFPGPFPARLTNFWYTTQVAGNAKAHKKMLALHEQYGDFVRIGSSDLSITHPDAVKAIYGLGTKCTKAAWYENDYPLTSMHTSRSRVMHDKRRRIWSPAFSDKALRGYETRIHPYTEQLREKLLSFDGKPVDVSKWFNFFSFDVMGDLAFGESFDMLSAGKEHWAIKLLNEGMEPLHLMLPPWFFRVLTSIPGLAAGYWKFIGYCSQKLDRRMQKSTETPDIMSVLLEPYAKAKPTGLDLSYLQGDSRLIIVAGSDTTAATLTHVFYHLAANPSRVETLRKELAPHASADGYAAARDLQDLPYLNGCINEALRLNPPVPTAVQRMTPPEGLKVGDQHVPGGMTVWAPQYVIGRSEKVYVDALEFRPERWGDRQDELIKEVSAFAPFSTGVFGCIGRPLALLELRAAVCMVVMGFDVKFADGETGKDLMDNTRDHFTLGLGELWLSLKPRAKA